MGGALYVPCIQGCSSRRFKVLRTAQPRSPRPSPRPWSPGLHQVTSASRRRAHAPLRGPGRASLPHRAGIRPQRTPTPRASIAEYIQTDGVPRIEPVARFTDRVTSSSDATPSTQKPVLIYLPGIEMSGYTWSKQTERLSADLSCARCAYRRPDAGAGLPTSWSSRSRRCPTARRRTCSASRLAACSRRASRHAVGHRRRSRARAGQPGDLRRPRVAGACRRCSTRSSAPPALGDAAYRSLQALIIALTAGEPLRMAARRATRLPPPRNIAAAAAGGADAGCCSWGRRCRWAASTSASPSCAGAAAINENTKALKALTLPVQLFASTEDKILPSSTSAAASRAASATRVTALQASGRCSRARCRSPTCSRRPSSRGARRRSARTISPTLCRRRRRRCATRRNASRASGRRRAPSSSRRSTTAAESRGCAGCRRSTRRSRRSSWATTSSTASSTSRSSSRRC